MEVKRLDRPQRSCAGLFFITIALAWLASSSVGLAEERVDAKLFVQDVLALPGKPMQLQAFLYKEGLLGKRIGLGGENIEFFVQNRLIGQSMTGGDGKAYLEFVPRLRGNLIVKAKVKGSPRMSDQEAEGLLAAWEKRRPILLVDLMSLLPPPKSGETLQTLWQSTLGEDHFPAPERDASSELEKLGEFYYNIIYLHRTNDGTSEAVSNWLKKHQFPVGVPIVVKLGAEAFVAFLDTLKADGWENVQAGIGRTVEFAEVLVERRVETVIIQESESKETYPRRAKIVRSWNKVRRYL
ncbi:MAG: hypothetical protein MRJ96_16090 [Nitrospirales bacterium]|nr:hypothetical protein [Nitrospira sp.]MDR4502965.1 hypothetical protein [Nitrospirales bacterium]